METFFGKRAKIFSILLIGESGSGKSTLIKIIENMKFEIKETNILPQTLNTYITEFARDQPNEGEVILMRLIDTPGFNDLNQTDSQLIDDIMKVIGDNISRINLILICIKSSERLTKTQLVSIESLIFKIPKEIYNNLGLLLTARDLSKLSKDQYITQFSGVTEGETIISACKAGIFENGVTSNEWTIDKVRVSLSEIFTCAMNKMTIPFKLIISREVESNNNSIKILNNALSKVILLRETITILEVELKENYERAMIRGVKFNINMVPSRNTNLNLLLNLSDEIKEKVDKLNKLFQELDAYRNNLSQNLKTINEEMRKELIPKNDIPSKK